MNQIKFEKFLLKNKFKVDKTATDYMRFKTDRVVIEQYERKIYLYNISNYNDKYGLGCGCGMEYVFFMCDINKKQLSRFIYLLDQYEIEYNKEYTPFWYVKLENEINALALEIRKTLVMRIK